MKTIGLNYGLGLLSTLSLVPASAETKLKKPNLIIIMTDQHRFDALGCVNKAVITPNLDGLASDGNLFTAAYSSTPSSTPARAGLLTGMSPWNHGMLGYGKQAVNYQYSMPKVLKEVGYQTFGIGKMHFYPQNNTQGFEVVINDESGRVDDDFFMSDYRKWFHSVALGQNPDKTGIQWNSHRAGVYALEEKLHPTTWTGDVAVSTIHNFSGEKPLLLKVSFARPHSPYDPPQRILGMYEGVDIPAPVVGDWVPEKWKETKVDNSRDKTAAIGAFGDDYAIHSRRHYYASISFVDEQVGRIVAALKERGLYDNSIIVFLSDHGDMLGDHHLWRKTYAYEGSSAIPFIVKLPKDTKTVVKAGEEIDYPVEIRDILPTFLEFAGIKQPEKMDGCSMLPLFQSKKPKWREFLDLEHATAYWKTNYWMALTDGKIKYVWNRATGAEELFDLEKDPYEKENFVTSKKYDKVLEKMRKAMLVHLSARGPKWVEDGKLKVSKQAILYSENFPEAR